MTVRGKEKRLLTTWVYRQTKHLKVMFGGGFPLEGFLWGRDKWHEFLPTQNELFPYVLLMTILENLRESTPIANIFELPNVVKIKNGAKCNLVLSRNKLYIFSEYLGHFDIYWHVRAVNWWQHAIDNMHRAWLLREGVSYIA